MASGTCTVRASNFSRTELFRVSYRTVLFASRIFFDETNFFWLTGIARFGKVRYAKSPVRDKVDARTVCIYIF
jgi:hypothetical protein